MSETMLRIFRLIVLVVTLLLAVVGILYVLDVFSDAQLRDTVEKTLQIAGIVTVVAVVIILLSGSRR